MENITELKIFSMIASLTKASLEVLNLKAHVCLIGVPVSISCDTSDLVDFVQSYGTNYLWRFTSVDNLIKRLQFTTLESKVTRTLH